MRNRTKTAPTRLTESRLRRIIREEISKLRGRNRKSLKEAMVDTGASTYYFDFDFADEEGELDYAKVGSDVTEVVRGVWPELPVGARVTMVNKEGPGGGWPELRVRGSMSQVKQFAAAWADESGEDREWAYSLIEEDPLSTLAGRNKEFGVLFSKFDDMAREQGADSCVDIVIIDPTEEFSRFKLGSNIAAEFGDFMYDEHGIEDVTDEDILIVTDKRRYEGVPQVDARFYGDAQRVRDFSKNHYKALGYDSNVLQVRKI